MSYKTSIEWTATINADGSVTPGSTWNPTRGCDKIAQGCKHCYAETFAERFRGVKGHAYEHGFDPRIAPDQLTLPLKWKKARRIFVDSMSDLFHEAFSFEYIARCFAVMQVAGWHTYQILTKRSERAAAFFAWANVCEAWNPNSPDHWSFGDNWPFTGARQMYRARFKTDPPNVGTWPLPNVWIGTSIAEQKDADKNIQFLLQIPAAVRFLSVEPLIGPVDLGDWLTTDLLGINDTTIGIDWVIVGGESGHGARPMHPNWVRSLRDQCVAAGVPFFFKQWGEHLPGLTNDKLYVGPMNDGTCGYFQQQAWSKKCVDLGNGYVAVRVGKKAAGRMLDGREWNEFPRLSPLTQEEGRT